MSGDGRPAGLLVRAEVGYNARQSGDELVRRSCQAELRRQRVAGVKVVAESPERGFCARRCVQDRDVRAVYFVPAEAVEVYAEGFDVDEAVRGECHAIDAEHSAGDGVDCVCDGADVVDAAEDVARVRAGYEFCFRG